MSVGYPGFLPQQQFIPSPIPQSPFGGGPFVQTQYRSTTQQYVMTQPLPGNGFQFGQPQFGGGFPQTQFGGGFPQTQFGGGFPQSPYGFGAPQPQIGGGWGGQFGPQQQAAPQLYVGNLWPVGQFSPQLGNQFIA
jgi:hypothetical protein